MNRRDDPRTQPLAHLTGRRSGLAAVVLLGAYLVPVALVWGIAQVAHVFWSGDPGWLALGLLTLGVGLVVGLTVRLGGWFQAVSFGEEYMTSFSLGAGFALGWWRLVLQLGSLVVVIMVAVGVETTVGIAQVSSDRTATLPAYAERVPVPTGWEPLSGSLTQDELGDRPNAGDAATR